MGSCKHGLKIYLPSGEIRRVVLSDRNDYDGLWNRVVGFLKGEKFALSTIVNGRKVYIVSQSSVCTDLESNFNVNGKKTQVYEKKNQVSIESESKDKEVEDNDCEARLAASMVFAFNKANLKKFWKIWIQGQTTRTSFGYEGTESEATIRVRDHGSESAARAYVETIVRQKKRKGYVDADAIVSPKKEVNTKGEWATWVMYIDDKTNSAYYYNAKTGESTWEEPPAYVTEKSATEFVPMTDNKIIYNLDPPISYPKYISLSEAILFSDEQHERATLKIQVEIQAPTHTMLPQNNMRNEAPQASPEEIEGQEKADGPVLEKGREAGTRIGEIEKISMLMSQLEKSVNAIVDPKSKASAQKTLELTIHNMKTRMDDLSKKLG